MAWNAEAVCREAATLPIGLHNAFKHHPDGPTKWNVKLTSTPPPNNQKTTTTIPLNEVFSNFLGSKLDEYCEHKRRNPEDPGFLLYVKPVPDSIVLCLSEVLGFSKEKSVSDDGSGGVGQAWREASCCGDRMDIVDQIITKEEEEDGTTKAQHVVDELVGKWTLLRGFHANRRHCDFETPYVEELRDSFNIDAYDTSPANMLYHFSLAEALVVDFSSMTMTFTEDYVHFSAADEEFHIAVAKDNYQYEFKHGVDGLAQCSRFGVNRMMQSYFNSLNFYTYQAVWSFDAEKTEAFFIPHSTLPLPYTRPRSECRGDILQMRLSPEWGLMGRNGATTSTFGGQRALLHAAYCGAFRTTTQLRALLSVLMPGQDSSTPICEQDGVTAAPNEHVQLSEAEKEFVATARTKQGYTVLHLAVSQFHTETLQVLLENMCVRSHHNSSSSSSSSSLPPAVAAHLHVDHMAQQNRTTPLMIAMRHINLGKMDISRNGVSDKKKKKKVTNKKNRTALPLTARKLNAVKLLLKCGADPSIATYRERLTLDAPWVTQIKMPSISAFAIAVKKMARSVINPMSRYYYPHNFTEKEPLYDSSFWSPQHHHNHHQSTTAVCAPSTPHCGKATLLPPTTTTFADLHSILELLLSSSCGEDGRPPIFATKPQPLPLDAAPDKVHWGHVSPKSIGGCPSGGDDQPNNCTTTSSHPQIQQTSVWHWLIREAFVRGGDHDVFLMDSPAHYYSSCENVVGCGERRSFFPHARTDSFVNLPMMWFPPSLMSDENDESSERMKYKFGEKEEESQRRREWQLAQGLPFFEYLMLLVSTITPPSSEDCKQAFLRALRDVLWSGCWECRQKAAHDHSVTMHCIWSLMFPPDLSWSFTNGFCDEELLAFGSGRSQQKSKLRKKWQNSDEETETEPTKRHRPALASRLGILGSTCGASEETFADSIMFMLQRPGAMVDYIL